MSALTDLIKLANKGNGKIPTLIPCHYVKWAYFEHKQSKELKPARLEYSRERDSVIKLPYVD